MAAGTHICWREGRGSWGEEGLSAEATGSIGVPWRISRSVPCRGFACRAVPCCYVPCGTSRRVENRHTTSLRRPTVQPRQHPLSHECCFPHSLPPVTHIHTRLRQRYVPLRFRRAACQGCCSLTHTHSFFCFVTCTHSYQHNTSGSYIQKGQEGIPNTLPCLRAQQQHACSLQLAGGL